MGLVLVNGAAGFVGSALVEELSAAGTPVRATDRPGSDLSRAAALGAEIAEQDLLDAPAVRGLFDGVDAAVNLAGLFSFDASYDALYDANVRCTDHFCRAALDQGVERLVHISTIGVYGPPVDYRIAESSLKRPRNSYERTKKLGEDLALHLCREQGLPVTVLRPALIYGPRSRYGQAPAIALLAQIKAARAGWLHLYDGGPEMHHLHVQDAAAAIRLLLEREQGVVGEAFNCGDRTPVNWGRWMQWVARKLELPFGIIPWYDWLAFVLFGLVTHLPDRLVEKLNAINAPHWRRVVEESELAPMLEARIEPEFLSYLTAHHVYDIAKLDALGFEHRFPDTEIGLNDTIDWYIRERWIPTRGEATVAKETR